MDDETKPNASIQCGRLCPTQASECKTLFISQGLWNVMNNGNDMNVITLLPRILRSQKLFLCEQQS